MVRRDISFLRLQGFQEVDDHFLDFRILDVKD